MVHTVPSAFTSPITQDPEASTFDVILQGRAEETLLQEPLKLKNSFDLSLREEVGRIS